MRNLILLILMIATAAVLSCADNAKATSQGSKPDPKGAATESVLFANECAPENGTPASAWLRTSSLDSGFGVPDLAMDASGNIYGTGFFQPPVPNGTQGPYPGLHAYLAKFDSRGKLEWMDVLGGENGQNELYVAPPTVGRDGGVYVTGNYNGTVDFDPGPGDESHTANIEGDFFISKFSPDGKLEWVKFWGGGGGSLNGIKAGSDGNLVIGGHFMGKVDLAPGVGADIHKHIGGNSFVMKIDPDAKLLWANVDEGEGWVNDERFSLDPSDNVCVSGSFRGSVDLDPGAGVAEYTSKETNDGEDDAFISKFDSSGKFRWAKVLDGDGKDGYYDIQTDSIGSIYALGRSHGNVDLDPGPGIDLHVSKGLSIQYISKYDPAGQLRWVRAWDNVQNIMLDNLVVDKSDNLILSGRFNGTVDMDPDPAVELIMTGSDQNSSFLSKFSPEGKLVSSRVLGSDGLGSPETILPQVDGNLILSGYFKGTLDFRPIIDCVVYSSSARGDAYLAKIAMP
jgi:hypothetical protein